LIASLHQFAYNFENINIIGKAGLFHSKKGESYVIVDE
jgi:hypothetical protein